MHTILVSTVRYRNVTTIHIFIIITIHKSIVYNHLKRLNLIEQDCTPPSINTFLISSSSFSSSRLTLTFNLRYSLWSYIHSIFFPTIIIFHLHSKLIFFLKNHHYNSTLPTPIKPPPQPHHCHNYSSLFYRP